MSNPLYNNTNKDVIRKRNKSLSVSIEDVNALFYPELKKEVEENE